MRTVTTLTSVVFTVVAPFLAMGTGRAGQAKGDAGTAVVLTKRTATGAYGTSAYSFRYATQDLALHRNAVDLVFNNCGLLHVSPESGLKGRVAKVAGTGLGEVTTFPNDGWRTQCFEPEKGALYVMEIDDGVTRMRVKFHVSAVSESRVQMDWAPFQDMTKGASGTMGLCGGHHEAK